MEQFWWVCNFFSSKLRVEDSVCTDNLKGVDLTRRRHCIPPAGPPACEMACRRPQQRLRAFVAGVTAALLLAASRAQAPAPLDAGLSANLAWLASSRAVPLGANTAAVVMCDNLGPATTNSDGSSYAPLPHTALSNGADFNNLGGWCTALLANGCLADTQQREWQVPVTPAAPFLCPPVGLGRRFVSVLRATNYAGGVTDTGTLVLYGVGSSWDRCAVVRGPFTAMAAAVQLVATQKVGIATTAVPTGTDLCALDAAGVLHCWADIPAAWVAAAPRWVPRAANDTARPATACLDITTNGTFLLPSPRLCPSAAAAAAAAGNAGPARDCVAPFALTSFSLSACSASLAGSHIIGVRTADRLSAAWLVGADTWEAAPPTGSTALEPLGLFTASGAPVPSDPRLPPILRCTDAVGSRVFIGRAANGSGYWEEPEVRQQGAAAASLAPPRRGLSATAVKLRLTATLMTSYRDISGMHESSGACGPFLPFSSSVAFEVNTASFVAGGIRASDGAIELPWPATSHFLPASPLQTAALVMPPGADMVCAAFAPAAALAGAAGAAALSPTWQAKCAGPLSLAVTTTRYSVPASVYAVPARSIRDARCMSRPPTALAVSRNTMAAGVAGFVDVSFSIPGYTVATTRPCSSCVMFYGYGPASSMVPTLSYINNASALALDPVRGAFVCAVAPVSAAQGSPRSLQCSGSGVPATAADRPPIDGSVPCVLAATTATSVCTTVNSSGWLWCFANDISQMSTAAVSLGLTTSVPAGTDPTRALLIQVNVTTVSASETAVCFLFSDSLAIGQLACIGAASDPLLATAAAGAAAAGLSGPNSAGSWVASRGGTAATLPLVAVSAGNAHACVLSSDLRPWCWGRTPAVAAVHADVTGRYIRIAVGGNSTCAVGLDGRIRCFGGILDAYIQDGQRSPWVYGNASVDGPAASPTADPLVPVMSAGLKLNVSTDGGDDALCGCATASATGLDTPPLPADQGGPVPCATLAGALAAVTRAVSASADSIPSFTVWIRGRVLAVPAGVLVSNNSTLPLPATAALLRIAGVTSSDATVLFAPCSTSSNSGQPQAALVACLVVQPFSVPGLVLQNLRLAPAGGSSQSCLNVLDSAVQTRIVGINIVGWNCSGPLLALAAPATTSDAAFSLAVAQAAAAREPTALSAMVYAELADVAFSSCTATAGLLASAVPAIRVASASASNCTFESALVVDQALFARVESVVFTSLASSAGSNSSLLPGAPGCGGGVRLNNVGLVQVSGVTASKITMPATGSGGGTICLSDVDHARTRAITPRTLRCMVEDIAVDGCALGGMAASTDGAASGCAVRAVLFRSPSATISISRVRVARASVDGSGAAVYVRAPAASFSNITCTDTFAAGSLGGGCLAADGVATAAFAGVVALRSVAAQAGGAIAMRGASPASTVAVRFSAFNDTAALNGDGGAMAIVGVSSVVLSVAACARAQAPRGSGGCFAVSLPRARSDLLTSAVSVSNVTMRSCRAGLRGGALSVIVGVLPGDTCTVQLQGSRLTANAAGNCALAGSNCPWLMSAPDAARGWWASECTACAAAGCGSSNATASTAALTACIATDGADVGGGAASIIFSRGTVYATGTGDAAVTDDDGIVSPRVRITDTLLDGNSAVAGGSSAAAAFRGRGGGLLLSRTDTAPSLALLKLRRVVLVDNTASGSGGGMSLRSTLVTAANLTVANCTSLLGDGGGVYATDASLVASPSFILAHNRAVMGSGGGAALSSCILGGLQLLGDVRELLAPSATPTASSTVTASVSSSVSVSATSSPTATLSTSRAASASPLASPTRSVSGTGAPSAAGTVTTSASPTLSPSPTASASPAELPGQSSFSATSLDRWFAPGIVLLNNSATVSGGGLALLSCDAVIGGSVIQSNIATEGGGLYAKGSSAVHLCAALLQMNLAASDVAVNADGSPSASTSFGGGLALVDLTQEAHLCDETACSRFLLVTATGSTAAASAASTSRLPFRALLALLVSRAGDALSLLGGPRRRPSLTGLAVPRLASDALRGASPPAPLSDDVAALWAGLAAAAAHAAAAQVGLPAGSNSTFPGAGETANCAWVANAADGPGGDVSLRSTSRASGAASSHAVAFLRQALLYASTSATAGGSVYAGGVPVSLSALDIVASVAGDAYACITSANRSTDSFSAQCNLTSSSGLRAAGYGGAVALYEPTYAELVSIRVVGPFARFGGALWLQPIAATASSSTPTTGVGALASAQLQLLMNVPLTWQGSGTGAMAVAVSPHDGRILLTSLSLVNASASAGGASIAIHGALGNSSGCSAQTCPAALQTLGARVLVAPAAGGPSARAAASAAAASLPVRMQTVSTLAPGPDGAIALVSSVAVPQPVAVLHLRDAFNATATWDDTSTCTALVIATDGGSLGLMHSGRYTAAQGVVTLWPFGIAAAPGAEGTLVVACEVALAGVTYTLRVDVARVATARVRLQLSAVSAPAPVAGAAAAVAAEAAVPFCNSTAASRVFRPATGAAVVQPVLLPTAVGTRPWAPDWLVRLTLTDVSGAAVVPPASLPCELSISSALDTTTGSAVPASLFTYGDVASTVVTLSSSSVVLPIAVAGAAGAVINVTASCRWMSGEAVLAGAPLMVETASLRLAWVIGTLAAPTSSAAGGTGNGSTTPASVSCRDWSMQCGDGTSSSCPLSFVDIAPHGTSASASATLGSWAAVPAWPLNVSGAAAAAGSTSAAGAGRDALLRTFAGLLGVRSSAGVLIVAPYTDSATAAKLGGSFPLLDADLWEKEWAHTATAALAPAALPSSLDGTLLLPVQPAPMLLLIASHASLPMMLAFPAGAGTCSAAIVPAAPAAALPSQATVLGSTIAPMTDGSVLFAALSIAGLPLGSSAAARLRIQCSMSGGEAQLAAALPLRVPAVRATMTSELPAIVAPSSSVAVAPLRSPLIHALTVEPAGSNASLALANASAALDDASLATKLRSVGAKLVCTLHCAALGAGNGDQPPCALEGRVAAPLEASATARFLAATVTLDGFGFSQLAAYPNRSCVTASCTWLDGQIIRSHLSCTAQPAPILRWCDELAANCSSFVSGALPVIAAPNEPLARFGAVVQTNPPGSLAELGLGAKPGSLRCALTATASASGPISFRGSFDVVANEITGEVAFTGVALQLTAAQAAELAASGALEASLRVVCSLNGQPFGSTPPRTVRLPYLRASWAISPPVVHLPATSAAAVPFKPALAVSLADARDPTAVVDAAGSCIISIAARWLPPDAVAGGAEQGAAQLNVTALSPGSAAFAQLTGSNQRSLVRGLAVFGDLGLAGSMGASVTLRAACTRDEGGDIAASEWNVSIGHAAVAWPSPAVPPPLLLSGRSLPVELALSWRVVTPAAAAAQSWRWGGSASSPVPVGEPLVPALAALDAAARILCSLALDDASATVADSPLDTVQYTAVAVPTNTSGSGTVALLVDLSGAAGRLARLQPSCSVGGHILRAPARLSTLATVSVRTAAPFPSVWLPSDGAAVSLMKPAPQLTLVAQDGSVPPTRGTVCVTKPMSAAGRNASAAIKAAVALVGAEAVAANLTAYASRWPSMLPLSLPGTPANGYSNSPGAEVGAPVVIDSLALRAGFGDWAALSVSCTRANKDPTLPLTALIRIGRMAVAWLQVPPAETSPGATFSVSVLLYDVDVVPEVASAGASASMSVSLSPSAAEAKRAAGGDADVFAQDHVSVCKLVPTGLSNGSGVVVDASSVVVQGGSGIAQFGIVRFPSASLTARVGTVVEGRVECGTGGLAAPDAVLLWRVSLSPCPVGSAPVGNGASCINCGRSYSDGGSAASGCTICPSVGAACSGGVLSLLPGFYRADWNPTVDENTELHPCALPFACWVNSSATNRSAAATHGCNEGYGNILCGVCAPGYARTGKKCGRCLSPAASWAVTALIPAAVFGFGAWAARRSISEASPFAPLTRIALGHVQLLGALMGAFIASGTGLVRELLGFAEVVGASPLAIAPVHCALGGLTFYTRFLLTLALAPALMFATLAAQLLFRCRGRCLGRKAAVVSINASTAAAAGPSPSRAPRMSVRVLMSQAAEAAAVGDDRSPSRTNTLGANITTSDARTAERVLNPLCAALPADSLRSQAASARVYPPAPDSLQQPTPVVVAEPPAPSKPNGPDAASSVPMAVSGSKSGCRARFCRAIDDPRVIGPAVFVLVSAARK